MKKKSDLLGIDLQEELTAIRAHRAGKKKLKTKKLKAPSNAAMIRHRLGLTQEAFAGFTLFFSGRNNKNKTTHPQIRRSSTKGNDN